MFNPKYRKNKSAGNILCIYKQAAVFKISEADKRTAAKRHAFFVNILPHAIGLSFFVQCMLSVGISFISLNTYTDDDKKQKAKTPIIPQSK